MGDLEHWKRCLAERERAIATLERQAESLRSRIARAEEEAQR